MADLFSWHQRCSGASLSAVVGLFKSSSAKRINEVDGMPGRLVWQRGFYEHLVRDAVDLARICEYIEQNPARWHRDRERTP